MPPGLRIDIAVSASPTGMNTGDPLPSPIGGLSDALIIADAVPSPVVTPWLTEASRRGIQVQNGEEMAVAQLPIQLGYLRLMPANAQHGTSPRSAASKFATMGDP